MCLDRLYAVYLAYSFTRSSDDERVRSFLSSLHDWFEVNNYDVYNEQKDNATGVYDVMHSGITPSPFFPQKAQYIQTFSLQADLRFETVVKVAANCHRMVVVLTPSFFQTDEKYFDVQTVRTSFHKIFSYLTTFYLWIKPLVHVQFSKQI